MSPDNEDAIEYAKEIIAEDVMNVVKFNNEYDSIQVEDGIGVDEGNVPDFVWEYLDSLNED